MEQKTLIRPGPHEGVQPAFYLHARVDAKCRWRGVDQPNLQPRRASNLIDTDAASKDSSVVSARWSQAAPQSHVDLSTAEIQGKFILRLYQPREGNPVGSDLTKIMLYRKIICRAH